MFASLASLLSIFANLLFPGIDQFLYTTDPLGPGGAVFDLLQHPAQRVTRIPVQSHLNWVVAPKFLGVDIQLNDGRALRRNSIVIGYLPPGVAANEKDQISLAQNLVGAGARVGAGNAYGQRVVRREHSFGIQSRRHGDGKLLSQAISSVRAPDAVTPPPATMTGR